MQENVFYLSARDSVTEFLIRESETFPTKFQTQFINFFSELCRYEEEGNKIRPTIILTSNIDAIVRFVPDAHKIPLFTDETEVQFAMRMKNLLPFCRADWIVYVDIKDDQITYGIVKALNSIKEKDLYTLVFENDALKERVDKLFVVGVEALSSHFITLRGLRGYSLNINFSLDLEKDHNLTDEIREFVNASFAKLRTTEKKLNQIKTLYENVFRNVFKNVEGALCVVVDKDYIDNGLFSDGVWLSEPISFSKMFLQSKSNAEAKLQSFCDIFIEMLNQDGIVIVDNTGTIRAYNVFVETNNNKVQKVSGGARKRAAFAVINSRRKRLIGVYFQSQDGEVFYRNARK